MSTKTMLIVAGITLAALAVATRVPFIKALVLPAPRTGPSGVQDLTPLSTVDL